MGRFKAFFTKEKIHAFLVHLGISMVIFLIILYFILVEWYPQPLFRTDGGWQGIQLIAFVDIVLGPLLTLIVFKVGKPYLKIDLSIIAIIQISALISGIIVVHNEHPVAIIIVDNRLHPITAYQVNEAGIELSSLQNYSVQVPPMIYFKMPKDKEKYTKLLADSLATGRGVRLYGEYYEKLSDLNKLKLIQNSMSIEKFIEEKPKEEAIYKKFLKNTALIKENLIYFPLYSRYDYGIAVLDIETFEILDILDIFPPRVSEEFQ